MFLSSFRRPPSSNNRNTPNRNFPATTISGASYTRARDLKGVDSKAPINPQSKPILNTPSIPQGPEPPKLGLRKEP